MNTYSIQGIWQDVMIHSVAPQAMTILGMGTANSQGLSRHLHERLGQS